MMEKFLIILHYMKVDFEYDESIFSFTRTTNFFPIPLEVSNERLIIGDSKGNIFNDNTFESVK